MDRKRLILAFLILGTFGLLVFFPWNGFTGEYHFAGTLLCYDCHTIHFSQSHEWGSGNALTSGAKPGGNWFVSTGPNASLLKVAGVTSLCLACHDGQSFAPDVLGGNTGTHVRQAGALTTGTAPYEGWKGHTLEATGHPPGIPPTCSNCHGGHPLTVPPPLRCTHCHDQHGNVYYRNLAKAYSGAGSFPGVTYAKGTNDTTKHVFLRSWTEGQIAANYGAGNVDFNEPDSTKSGMGEWCGQCHGKFHGQKGDSNMGGSTGTAWLRHPTADANIGAFATDGEHSSLDVFRNRVYRVKVMSSTGDWGTQGSTWPGAPATLTPTCISCHKGHGNQNPFGLIFMGGSGTGLTEEGDGTASASVKDLCRQCHVQGN